MNAIGSLLTIVMTGGKSPGASTIWFAYSGIAMYDAVNAITGQYQPFYYRIAGPASASIDAAAVAAASSRFGQLFSHSTSVASIRNSTIRLRTSRMIPMR